MCVSSARSPSGPASARTEAKHNLHPSNIHDNAYAVGTIDFTGDMPVILGPDGPSLGGFVCPATIVEAGSFGEDRPIEARRPGPLPVFNSPPSTSKVQRNGKRCDYADIRHNYANTPQRTVSESEFAKGLSACDTLQITEFLCI